MSVIQNFMTSLDTTTKSNTKEVLDEAVRACSRFENFQDLVDNAVSDCRKSGDGNVFLKDYCGIDLNNEDTGAITGFDAGGSVVKTQSSVVPENESIDTNFEENSFTVNGLKVMLGDETNIKSARLKNVSDLNSKQKYAWQALHSVWIKAALDLNAESYGNNFGFSENSSATVKRIYVYFTNDDDYFAEVHPYYHEDGDYTSDLDFYIPMNVINKINENDKDGIFTDSDQTYYLDHTIAHEFTHAVMVANMHYSAYKSLPTFVREGIAELTCGIDFKRKEDIQFLASNPDELEKYLSDMSNSNENINKPYSAGYILFRYLNKQASQSTVPDDQYIVYSGGNQTVSSYSESQQVNLATDFTGVAVNGDNFIVKSSSGQLEIQNVRGKYVKYGDENSNLVAYSYMGTNGSSSYSSVNNSYSSYNTIDARSRGAAYDVLIGGNNSSNVIYAGSGGSSLWGGNGSNDTLVGGSGHDEFAYKYGNGNDVIQDASGADLVDLSSINLSQITSAEVRLSGVTIRFNDGGTLRVEGNASGMSYKVAEGTYRCNQYADRWE